MNKISHNNYLDNYYDSYFFICNNIYFNIIDLVKYQFYKMIEF